jgi:hypothetical protein
MDITKYQDMVNSFFELSISKNYAIITTYAISVKRSFATYLLHELHRYRPRALLERGDMDGLQYCGRNGEPLYQPDIG